MALLERLDHSLSVQSEDLPLLLMICHCPLLSHNSDNSIHQLLLFVKLVLLRCALSRLTKKTLWPIISFVGPLAQLAEQLTLNQ